jgi:hypothetical protein
MYPELKDNPNKFLSEFKNNPALYNHIANTHWKRLKNTMGSVTGAAFAWRHGIGAAIRTHQDLHMADPYVQSYQKMFLNGSKPVQKSEIEQWQGESELIKAAKIWRSRDGVTVPVLGTPERAAYDQRFFEALDQNYGAGARKALRPIKINLDDVETMNTVHNHDRYNMYLRMARGGDKLPPVIVKRMGNTMLLLDGNHRWNAARKAKLNQLDAYEVVDQVVKRSKKTV